MQWIRQFGFTDKRSNTRKVNNEKKIEIIEDYLSSDCTKQEIWFKHTGQVTEKGRLLRWMLELGYTDTKNKKTTNQLMITQKEIKQDLKDVNCLNFCNEVYDLCNEGYIQFSMQNLVKKHTISNNILDALKSLNMLKSLGPKNNMKYYWSGSKPDENITLRIKNEIRKMEANKKFAELPGNLTPIINEIYTVSEILDVLRYLRTTYPDNHCVMDPTTIRDKKIPEGTFETLLTLDMIKKSIISTMYVWNTTEKPNLALAELVCDNINKNFNKVVKINNIENIENNTESILENLAYNANDSLPERARKCLLDIKNKLTTNNKKFVMSNILRSYHILPTLSSILQAENILNRTGVFKNSIWTWIYEGEINIELAEDLIRKLNAFRSKYKYDNINNAGETNGETSQLNSIKEVINDDKVLINESIVDNKILDDVKLSYIEQLKKEEKELTILIESLPEVQKLNKIKNIISLISEI